MSRFDDDLTDLLYAASQEAPPSQVDLGTVLHDGRRRRRRRAVVTPLLVAAAVFGLAAAGLAASNLRPDALRPQPPATVVPTTTAPAELSEFPLDRQLFALDQTMGLPFVALNLATDAQQLQYGPALGHGITAWVYPVGVENPWFSDPGRDWADAPPIGGRPASFLWQPADPVPDGDPASLQGIAFQWAPGAWAMIFYHAENESQLITLAESLRTDVDEPARFGLTVSPPPGLALRRATPFLEGAEGPGLFSGLEFAVSAPSSEPSEFGPPTVSVRVDYDDVQWVGEGVPMVANTTVAGHPAFVLDRRQEYNPSYAVYLLDEGQPVVSVSVYGTGAVELFGPEQANALASSVHVLGTWDDRSHWTVDPLR